MMAEGVSILITNVSLVPKRVLVIQLVVIEGMNNFKSVTHNVGLFYIILIPSRQSPQIDFDRKSC